MAEVSKQQANKLVGVPIGGQRANDPFLVPPSVDDKFKEYLKKPMCQSTASNPSGIIPVEYKVVVLPRKVEEKTKGGIIRPDIVLEKDEHAAVEGIIVALSPLAFTYEEWPAGARKPQAGDSVLFARYSGIRHKGKDGETYVIMNDKDIAAIMEGANV